MIAPHPDDETAGCAGTLMLHRQAGDSVTVACVTDGSGSAAVPGSSRERSAHRRREMEAALDVLAIDTLHWIDLKEGRWSFESGVASIGDLIEKSEPTVIYAPSRLDFHPEHRKVACCLASVLRESGTAIPVRIYPVLVPLSPLLVNLEADVSPLTHRILEAMQAHASQFGTLARTMRRRRYSAAIGRHSGVWEDAWELDANTYSEIHADFPPQERFWGLRFDPWTDPLAYLVGRGISRSLHMGTHRSV